MFKTLVEHRYLIWTLCKKDIESKYKTTIIGRVWLFAYPLLMLTMYTLVFKYILKARWGIEESTADFSLILFSGLICHTFLAECFTQSTAIIVQNANYVKKVVFPLENLAWIHILSSLFQVLISFVLLILAVILINGIFHWQIIFLPIVFLPLVFVGLGVFWILSALGVYFRDLSQITGLLATALLFLAPIFYPLTLIPEAIRHYWYLNPLTSVVSNVRAIILEGNMPNWSSVIALLFIGLFISFIGHKLFLKMRVGFNDVL